MNKETQKETNKETNNYNQHPQPPTKQQEPTNQLTNQPNKQSPKTHDGDKPEHELSTSCAGANKLQSFARKQDVEVFNTHAKGWPGRPDVGECGSENTP